MTGAGHNLYHRTATKWDARREAGAMVLGPPSRGASYGAWRSNPHGLLPAQGKRLICPATCTPAWRDNPWTESAVSEHSDSALDRLMDMRHARFAAPRIARDVCAANLLARMLQTYGRPPKVSRKRWRPVLKCWSDLVSQGLTDYLAARTFVEPVRERAVQAAWLVKASSVVLDLREGRVHRGRIRELLGALDGFPADGRRPANVSAARAAHADMLDASKALSGTGECEGQVEAVVAALEQLLQGRGPSDLARAVARQELEAFLDLASPRSPLGARFESVATGRGGSAKEVQARRSMSGATLALLTGLTGTAPTATWDELADDPLDTPAIRALSMFYKALRGRLAAGGLIGHAELGVSALGVSGHAMRDDIRNFLAGIR